MAFRAAKDTSTVLKKQEQQQQQQQQKITITIKLSEAHPSRLH